ncbi:helix-turn-helix domain-containing protein [Bosea sp. Root670]|uniref:helix-turn-helix domain-containing protein n=1 Tax=Bosea sp. Root670 TaxID=1736583 RepID=UPI0039B7765E
MSVFETPREILTESEAAELLGCTPIALRLRRARHSGACPPYARRGRRIYYMRTALLEWVTAGMESPVAAQRKS